MRVLHLCTSDRRGGAARGAYFLHRRLREAGVDSKMLVGRKYSDDPTVTQLDGALAPVSERVRSRLDRLPLRGYEMTDESFWSVAWQPRRLGPAVREIAPDLVHLQWIGGGFLSVEALEQIQAPVIWTLRDMWAFTGGCHYTAGCERYVDGCGTCPQLSSSREDDLSRETVQRKLAAWMSLDLSLVPISSWMEDRALESAVLAKRPSRVIPNGIDTTIFRPQARRAARRSLGLPEDGRYVLFSALNPLKDERKGFRHLAEALQRYGASASDRPELLIAGALEPEDAPELPVGVRYLGQIDDDARLATAYAAADVVAAPSLQEAFGKVHAEAMACGTPVVAFNSGGPGEIVRHKETGYLAAAFEAEDLGRGLDWCLAHERPAELADAARGRSVSHYDIGVVAEQYIELYHDILEVRHDRSAA